MTWSYSGDPSSSDRDAVRFLIGDTDTTDQQLSNEEINYLLVEYTSVDQTAIAAIGSLIAKYSRYVDQSTGDISLSYSQRINQFKELLNNIRRRMAEGVRPYCGGLSIADKELDVENDDRVDPAFYEEMWDNNQS